MRKTVFITAIALLVASFAAPAAGAVANRTENREYSMGDGMVTGNFGLWWQLGTNWEAFRAQAGERFVSFEVADASGQPVRGHIHMDMDGNGKLDKVDDFCTTTPEPIAVKPGRKIEVSVVFGTCPDGETQSIVTQGTISATFSE